MKQIAIFLSLLISTTLYAQKKYGNVVDQTGSPIIGATVLEEGTTNGTNLTLYISLSGRFQTK